jgi:hypothetical protein
LVLLILDLRRWSSATWSSFANKSSAAIADLRSTSIQVCILLSPYMRVTDQSKLGYCIAKGKENRSD